MIDLALDAITRDLILPPRALDGPARVAQSVGIRLRCWLGEWFLDTGHGVPYLESVLGKAPRPEIVEAILRAQILDVAGVRSISSFNMTIDPRTRIVRVDFTAETAEGPTTGALAIQG